MTRLFRSKSHAGTPPSAGFFQDKYNAGGDDEAADSFYQDYSYFHINPIITPFISPDGRQPQSTIYTILALVFSAIRKSIITCAVDDSDDASSATSSLDIGLPTDVQHVSHVTFDRFDGFYGLPVELQYVSQFNLGKPVSFGLHDTVGELRTKVVEVQKPEEPQTMLVIGKRKTRNRR
ncbi:hypothetical protein L1987_25056 [Smallanthus sonchifolius]|uniref:Uncharacterized protein n=1 Tax=Smallanthus sonchifolius TaxID=185202 RepID=A0ACB9INH9_9ASTR|nr:hypothetical protein L1987_25056 [Smallanthus sonchifolius]